MRVDERLFELERRDDHVVGDSAYGYLASRRMRFEPELKRLCETDDLVGVVDLFDVLRDSPGRLEKRAVADLVLLGERYKSLGETGGVGGCGRFELDTLS